MNTMIGLLQSSYYSAHSAYSSEQFQPLPSCTRSSYVVTLSSSLKIADCSVLANFLESTIDTFRFSIV